jgi:hypothetical protein
MARQSPKADKASFPKGNNGPETGPSPAGESPETVREIVLRTCREIAGDSAAPPAARVQAARTLAEMAGFLGKVQTGALDTGETREAEMSPEDIDRAIARLSGTGKLQ